MTVALNEDVRQFVARSDQAPSGGASADRPDLGIEKAPGKQNGVRVTLRNAGTAPARNVVVGLEGALFMLNADHERIGGDTADEVGDLTPGGTRRWNVGLRAAQTSC